MQKIGRLCERHDGTEQRTGHHSGHSVRVKELAPYLKDASRYIKQHQHHPAIAEAIRRTAELVYGSRPRSVGQRHNATPHERIYGWLDRLEHAAVPAEELLSIVAAMFFYREDQPNAFRSDRHFRHQLVLRFLRKAPAPVAARWRSGEGGRRYDRITVATRDLLATKLENTIGLVSLRVAMVLHQARNPYSPEQNAAVRTPLPTSKETE
ncbi:hypothetical protein [Dongia deserti]|uniref:hypothetical protein n=1 Tax=Dongia deserti TaxID=2268030 RepID=UPI0013C438BF|nr:hypothetical protein [Dongia deserti]